MAKNELITKFVWDNLDDSKVDSTRRNIIALHTDINNLGKNTVVGKNIADSIKPAETALGSLKKKVDDTLKAPVDNSLKNALADIKRMQAENIAGEKAVTRSIERESKLQADAKIKEAKRAANEALRTLKTPDRTPTAQGLNLSSFQKQNLSYQVNDVLTGLASGQNVTQIAAQQSGQIAQIFNPAQGAALVAAYGSLVAIAGAGATAIALTYKLTGDLRAQAEKRLGVETSISAAINKQVIGLRESNAEYEKFKRSLDQAQSLSSRITSAVNSFDATAIKNERDRIDESNKSRIAEISRLKADLAQKENALEFAKNRNVNQGILTGLGFGREYTEVQKQQDVRGAENDVEKTRKRLAEQENALQTGKAAYQQTNQALSDITTKQNEAFNQRNEIFKRTQENERKFAVESLQTQEKRIEAEKKFQAEVEKGKKKVDELGKSYRSIFDGLPVKTNSNNPFVAIFSESRNELEKLKDSIKGLPQDLQNAAIESQGILSQSRLFETRLDNNLSAFDLRETANRFRNPRSDTLVDKKRFEQIVQASILTKGSYGEFITNNLRREKNGNSEISPEQERSIYEVSQLRFLQNPNANFNSVLDGNINDRSLISRLARERVGGFDENLSLNDRLSKQLSIINSGISTDAERGIADRRLIGLTSGLDPSQIKSELREQIAAANEREAVRKENYERELLRVQKEDLEVNKRIAAAQEKLLEIAEKDGIDGLNKFLEITVRDETRYGVDTGAAGTQTDVRKTYFDEYD